MGREWRGRNGGGCEGVRREWGGRNGGVRRGGMGKG